MLLATIRDVMRARLLAAVMLVLGLLVLPVDAGQAGELAVITGTATTHVVAAGETLAILAARFGVDVTTIASDNHLAVGRPLQVGRSLLIDNRHIIPSSIAVGEIVINVPQRMLFYRDGTGVLAYPIAVGRTTWQTPEGSFTVVRKQENPTWHVPASIRAESARKGQSLPLVVPPGPRNPLGRFWIALSLGSIGVHGTPSPSSIYQAATHGCIRLQSDHIESLFDRVAVGTRGRIVYEPVLLTADAQEIYIEVHRDVYGRLSTSAAQQARDLAARLALGERIDWTLADGEIEQHAGIARRLSVVAD